MSSKNDIVVGELPSYLSASRARRGGAMLALLLLAGCSVDAIGDLEAQLSSRCGWVADYRGALPVQGPGYCWAISGPSCGLLPANADACQADPKTRAKADVPVIDVYRIGSDGSKCELGIERCE